MNNPWKTLSSKIMYENPWIKVREDAVVTPSGENGIYGVVEVQDSVIVGAVNENNEIYLIYLFSYPSQTWGVGATGWREWWRESYGCRETRASRRNRHRCTGLD